MEPNTTNAAKRSGVIWISGYSASGKTTVGRNVEYLLREQGYPTLFLDGDELRSIFAGKWGYTREDRIELSLIYFRLCSHLSKQGMIVVISVVSMFDEVRHWFRENIDEGLEVFLRVPLEERIRRDSKTKKVYGKIRNDLDMYTEPSNPDVLIDHFGAITPIEASRQIVKNYHEIQGKRVADYGRTNHWRDYYKNDKVPSLPSSFAEYCINKITSGCRIVDVGCGNGRDSIYFARQGHHVVGVDKSKSAIEYCQNHSVHVDNSFICCELTDLAGNDGRVFDVVYSRFSLHAMTPAEEDKMLKASHGLLVSGGLLCIECRSINDPLARRGEVLSPTERVDGHYRRFIELLALTQKLERMGFAIEEQIEASGLAVHKDDDPVVIRVIARKQ